MHGSLTDCNLCFAKRITMCLSLYLLSRSLQASTGSLTPVVSLLASSAILSTGLSSQIFSVSLNTLLKAIQFSWFPSKRGNAGLSIHISCPLLLPLPPFPFSSLSLCILTVHACYSWLNFSPSSSILLPACPALVLIRWPYICNTSPMLVSMLLISCLISLYATCSAPPFPLFVNHGWSIPWMTYDLTLWYLSNLPINITLLVTYKQQI